MTAAAKTSAARARYLMIGGFLGAGKTTAVARLAQRLTDAGQRVGLITNDQGRELVDTQMLRAHGFATEEIPGGCFCCRFNSLVEAAQKLTDASRPDVFIAEPVGSCTDLVATVTYPLRRIYGEQFSIAPLSVLVDPVRARRVFGLERGGNFSEKVIYIFKKQLEEADVIVISKSDTLTAAQIAELRAALAKEFPRSEILAASPRTGAGLDEWFAKICTGEQTLRRAMEVDYDIYADGEALLGWLNCTVQLSAAAAFDADALLERLARDLQSRLARAGGEIAHLKMTLSPDEGFGGDVAVINLVRNDFVPELSLKLESEITKGQLIINCRAELAPDALAANVQAAIAALTLPESGLETVVSHLEHFRPGRPTPTHRDLNPAGAPTA
ncbi:MAG: cobalamin biosynthesis protein P47K [Verrucomicrobia bacterium]|nr:cobalamin biosynthesis protein P47K [Verrucomicrobiota bacterium]